MSRPARPAWFGGDSRRRGVVAALLVSAMGVLAAGAAAQSTSSPDVGQETGLPLPRFATIHGEPVNARTGPGTRYPIEWTYTRGGIPIEIVGEFDTWRRIRDWDGEGGWVHLSVLSGRRTVVTIGETRSLRAEPSNDSGVVAYVEEGAFGNLDRCEPAWCELVFDGAQGWMQRSEFWGSYPGEVIE